MFPREPKSVYLVEGAATWFRVGPQNPIKEPLKITDIQKHAQLIATVPLFMIYYSSSRVGAADGVGMYAT
jgi:hypothetical protein